MNIITKVLGLLDPVTNDIITHLEKKPIRHMKRAYEVKTIRRALKIKNVQ